MSLIDTFRWDTLFTNKQIAEMFGFKKAYCINLGDSHLKKRGHDNGMTVLSNLPSAFEKIRLVTRNAIKTTINQTYDIYSVYLDDIDENVKIKQINKLLKIVKLDRPVIITGDLNTLSYSDSTKITAILKKTFKVYPSVNNKLSGGKGLEMLAKYGLIDSDKYQNPTTPTKFITDIVKGVTMRLDYTFHTKDIQVTNFKVLTNKVFDQISDHYPIVFELI